MTPTQNNSDRSVDFTSHGPLAPVEHPLVGGRYCLSQSFAKVNKRINLDPSLHFIQQEPIVMSHSSNETTKPARRDVDAP